MVKRILADVELRDDVQVSEVVEVLEQFTDGSDSSVKTVVFPKHQDQANLDSILNLESEDID
jgi:hypothetical protein